MEYEDYSYEESKTDEGWYSQSTTQGSSNISYDESKIDEGWYSQSTTQESSNMSMLENLAEKNNCFVCSDLFFCFWKSPPAVEDKSMYLTTQRNTNQEVKCTSSETSEDRDKEVGQELDYHVCDEPNTNRYLQLNNPKSSYQQEQKDETEEDKRIVATDVPTVVDRACTSFQEQGQHVTKFEGNVLIDRSIQAKFDSLNDETSVETYGDEKVQNDLSDKES